MYQRLLLLLAVLCISVAAISQSVINSGDGDNVYNAAASSGSVTNPRPFGIAAGATDTLQKWVHDPTQKNRITFFDQSQFKSYRLGNFSFRLRFPNNYDSTKKYPMVVFLHGAGEACNYDGNHNNLFVINSDGSVGNGIVDRENQDQLFWGADTFQVRINRGEWNGFLLFGQLYTTSTQWGGDAGSNLSMNHLNTIMDTLTQYKGLDPDRVIVMGLSAGGVGSIRYGRQYPTRIASIISASPELLVSETDHAQNAPSLIANWKQIPIYMTSGGEDFADNSTPPDLFKGRDSIAAYGANIYFGFYVNDGHDTWERQWYEKDVSNNFILTNYWNNASKAEPVVYFQNTKFCTGQSISAKMGITPGFYAYEWQTGSGNSFSTIAGATSSDYTATQAGSYRVHFKRTSTSDWSAWSPNPVIITSSPCFFADTAFAEHFDEQTALVSYVAATPSYQTTAYYKQNFTCYNGLFPNLTEEFTHDALKTNGGRFMSNFTLNQDPNPAPGTSATQCTYNATDQVYRTYNPATVLPNTNYTLSFYMGNLDQHYTDNSPETPAYLVASVNNTVLTPAYGVKAEGNIFGDASWRKFSYTWNSGSSTTAQIAIQNNTTSTSWNDFTLDEILLVKTKPSIMPGAALGNFSLWSKATSIPYPDNTLLKIWNNDDVNGYSLLQINNLAYEPTYKNNSTDNINFNPIVKFISASNNTMQVDTGFAKTNVHNAVHAYFVANFSNVNQTNHILLEDGTNTDSIAIGFRSPGAFAWTVGNTATTITTPANSIDPNKATLWSFSKDNNHNTGSGNKEEIRKNGLVLASGNNTTTFTGANLPFYIGNYGGSAGSFDGSVAEVVYVMDSVLTPLAENKIESYLALKYGTSLGSTSTPVNYTASDGTTIFWPANNSYQNDVFGIGTDSASGLIQAISNSVNSGSGNGTGQSAKGNLVLSTETSLNDKQFVMIGNDAGTLAQHVITSNEAQTIAVGSTRVGRNWKVANTNTGVVDLSFDTTGLGNQAGGAVASNYALMIDLDGDGNYKTGTLAFFTATSASGNKIMFSGATLNNGVVFTIITFKLASTLPATWLSFTAVAQNGNALLNWKTGDEINVDNYTVEHSFNGVSFSAIGSVAANNYSGTNSYNYTDRGLTPGTHYYRIRRTDLDGNNGLSDTKTIQVTTTGANVQVMPNPIVGSNLILSVTVQQSSKTNLQVMGVDGKVILHQSINLASGNNMLNLNVSNVPPGIYLVQVQLNDEVVTKKFVKER